MKIAANLIAIIVLAALADPAVAAGKLEIENAWIRLAPPGAMMLAGYATLRNTGDAPVAIRGAASAGFGSVSLHSSFERDGVVRMRPVDTIAVQPGASVVLEPGGYHLMLMQPRREFKIGDAIPIRFATDSGESPTVQFSVREDAP